MTSNEIRRVFLDFFKEKQHKELPSASLIPDDQTLLFTIAGMVPFKPIFQGKQEPVFSRATTAQKCIRTNDIDRVGYTARHHTFFEMLGNFSFGDYYKREAISWAWEFLFKRLELPAEKAHIGIYKDDEESYDIWHKEIGVPDNRIYRLGDESNFWAAGPTGPCGPCSEIFIDKGPEYGCGRDECNIECDCGRYLEIWNLVFMQYERDENGDLSPLPRKNIDTGVGLERLASVLQGADSNFETDLFLPVMEAIDALSTGEDNEEQKRIIAKRIIADHIRAMAFLIADGIIPSNEGRGYVLRRIIRRAVRTGRTLGINEPFLSRILPIIIADMGGHYHELRERRDTIERVCSIEEERFRSTIEQGEALLNEEITRLSMAGDNVISGATAFKLYDTYGYPVELTREIAEDRGLIVDGTGFERLMDEQKVRARKARMAALSSDSGKATAEVQELESGLASEWGKTEFIGYSQLELATAVKAILKHGSVVSELSSGHDAEIVLAMTPFYVEKGGQVSDTGTLHWPGGEAKVNGLREGAGGVIFHSVMVVSGTLETNKEVRAVVDAGRRADIARNHTAAHLLHASLRRVLGCHVAQAGSMVDAERLRFDFSHFSAPSKEELAAVEAMVNEQIWLNTPVDTVVTDLTAARDMGAIALFGEKYGGRVRVVRIDDFSLELCGGTHVRSVGELGCFKILSESSIGSGIRRIEALTGRNSFNYINEQVDVITALSAMLKAGPKDLPGRITSLVESGKEAERTIRSLRADLALAGISDLLSSAINIDGIKVVAAVLKDADAVGLRAMVDNLKQRIDDGVIILGSVSDGSAQMVASIGEEARGRGANAGKIVKEMAKVVGGGGGGRPDMAQAGGPDGDRIDEAVEKGREIVMQLLAHRS
ncbi:MAG: alanine--tRNA ligase [bacterium]